MSKTRADIREWVRNKIFSWPELVTTLNGGITATTQTIVLTSGTYGVERMLLEIESEIVRIVTISGATVSACFRGDKGTTAASHSTGVTINGYPFWGWTDRQLNNIIEASTNWLGEGMCYTLKPYVNTWLSAFREFGLPAGVVYPTGNIVKKIEMQNDDGIYVEILGWRHVGDRIILSQVLTKDMTVRIWIQTKQAVLSDDVTTLDESKHIECIQLYSAARALDELVANRARFYEYSSALNDRASSADELQRAAYFMFNQALILRDQFSRPGLSGFAPIHRG